MVKQKRSNGLISRKFLGQCKHIKQDGQRCRAIANKETGLCSIHSGLVPRLEGDIDLEGGVVHVRKFLARVAMLLKKGKIKANDANAIANLCDKVLKCHQYIDEKRELAELKALMLKQSNTYPYNVDEIEILDDI